MSSYTFGNYGGCTRSAHRYSQRSLYLRRQANIRAMRLREFLRIKYTFGVYVQTLWEYLWCEVFVSIFEVLLLVKIIFTESGKRMEQEVLDLETDEELEDEDREVI